jgi:hypothetical protein
LHKELSRIRSFAHRRFAVLLHRLRQRRCGRNDTTADHLNTSSNAVPDWGCIVDTENSATSTVAFVTAFNCTGVGQGLRILSATDATLSISNVVCNRLSAAVGHTVRASTVSSLTFAYCYFRGNVDRTLVRCIAVSRLYFAVCSFDSFSVANCSTVLLHSTHSTHTGNFTTLPLSYSVPCPSTVAEYAYLTYAPAGLARSAIAAIAAIVACGAVVLILAIVFPIVAHFYCRTQPSRESQLQQPLDPPRQAAVHGAPPLLPPYQGTPRRRCTAHRRRVPTFIPSPGRRGTAHHRRMRKICRKPRSVRRPRTSPECLGRHLQTYQLVC